jgi:hypothetical protein
MKGDCASAGCCIEDAIAGLQGGACNESFAEVDEVAHAAERRGGTTENGGEVRFA